LQEDELVDAIIYSNHESSEDWNHNLAIVNFDRFKNVQPLAIPADARFCVSRISYKDFLPLPRCKGFRKQL